MRHLRIAVAAACVGAATLFASAAPAAAAPDAAAGRAAAGPASPVAGPSAADGVPVWDPATRTSRLMRGEAARKAIEAFWTPERMAGARPAVAPDRDAAADEAPPADASAKARVDLPVPARAGLANHAAFSHASGKVFFVDPRDGLTYVCSASAQGSAKRRLVLTAGHCLHSGDSSDTWLNNNWIFVPGYDNGARPNGTFSWWQPWVFTAWRVNGNSRFDYGFMIMGNNEFGQKVVDAVGGHGLQSNSGSGISAHIIGYPTNLDAGQLQWFCWGTTTRDGSSSTADQRITNCPMQHGSSGGPWLRDYNHTNGLGVAFSVVSHGNLAGTVDGPYFTSDVFTLKTAAENASPA